MNKATFFELVKNPELLSDDTLTDMVSIVNEYPWFQAARILLVKNMHVIDHLRYNSELRMAAAHIPDRTRLYNLIHASKPNEVAEDKLLSEKETVRVVDEVPIVQKKGAAEECIDEPVKVEEVVVKTPVLESSRVVDDVDNMVLPSADFLEYDTMRASTYRLKDTVDIEEAKEENHSFSDWLNVLRHAPKQEEVKPEQPVRKSRQLIDSFLNIEVPRITAQTTEEGPQKVKNVHPHKASASASDNEELMTETLAGIFIKQKHYDKAFVIFEKLRLKYPEKNAYFAQRLSDLEKLINNQ